MVINTTPLDRVFSALSDPTRRAILERLSEGATNVSTLAAPFALSQPAVSKHLRVLEEAGLIHRTRQGRERIVRVDPRPIAEARGWMAQYARYWQRQFDAVDELLKNRRTGKSGSQRARKERRRS